MHTGFKNIMQYFVWRSLMTSQAGSKVRCFIICHRCFCSANELFQIQKAYGKVWIVSGKVLSALLGFGDLVARQGHLRSRGQKCQAANFLSSPFVKRKQGLDPILNGPNSRKRKIVKSGNPRERKSGLFVIQNVRINSVFKISTWHSACIHRQVLFRVYSGFLKKLIVISRVWKIIAWWLFPHRFKLLEHLTSKTEV